MTRILHLPTAVGNHGYSLACAEQRKGFDSSSLIVGANPFDFRCHRAIATSGDPISKVIGIWERYREFRRCSHEVDILHFNFGSSLLSCRRFGIPHWDISRYPKSVVKIATFNGSDIRDERAFATNPYSPYHNSTIYSKKAFASRRNFQTRFCQEMDHIFVLNPDLMRCVPKEKSTFLPYIKEAWFNRPQQVRGVLQNSTVKIVHAPTNRWIKGTDQIVDAVNRLEALGYLVELVLIEGYSHDEALKLYQQADIVIDQLKVGWYGGFALEVARLGRPVITYIHEDYLNEIEDSKFCAGVRDSFISANPKTIFETLKKCIDEPEFTKDRAARLFDFVEQHHNPDKLIDIVTSKYISLLMGSQC